MTEDQEQVEARVRRETTLAITLEGHDSRIDTNTQSIGRLDAKVEGLERKVENVQRSMVTQEKVEKALRDAKNEGRAQNLTIRQFYIGVVSILVILLAAVITPVLTVVLK